MRNSSTSLPRGLRAVVAALVAVLGVTAIAMAAGGASSSKAGKVKVKCPARVLAGQGKVTYRLFGRLPAGPQGPQGPKGPKGSKGDKGQKGEKGDGGTDLGTNATQNGQQRSVSVSLSAPNGTGWSAQLFNNETTGGGTSIDLRVYAICASVS